MFRLLAGVTLAAAMLGAIRAAAVAGMLELLAVLASFVLLSACGFFGTVYLVAPFDPELTSAHRQHIRRIALRWLVALLLMQAAIFQIALLFGRPGP